MLIFVEHFQMYMVKVSNLLNKRNPKLKWLSQQSFHFPFCGSMFRSNLSKTFCCKFQQIRNTKQKMKICFWELCTTQPFIYLVTFIHDFQIMIQESQVLQFLLLTLFDLAHLGLNTEHKIDRRRRLIQKCT